MFYEQLKKACKMNNTSVTATLKALGVSATNGTYWKNGSIPSSDIVVQLSEFLNVSTDYLLKGGDPITNEVVTIKNQSPTITNSSNVRFGGIIRENSDYSRLNLNETTKELIKVFESLPTREQIKLMNLVYDFEENYKQDNNT